MAYTFEIYRKTDTNDEQLNAARKSFKYEGQDMYIISKNGSRSIVQSESRCPFKGETIEESARNHIAALIEQEKPQEEQPDRVAVLESIVDGLLLEQLQREGAIV